MQLINKKFRKIIAVSLLAAIALSFFCANVVFASTMVKGETSLMEMKAATMAETNQDVFIALQDAANHECRATSPLGIAPQTAAKTSMANQAPIHNSNTNQLACCRDQSHRLEAISQNNNQELLSVCFNLVTPLAINIEPANMIFSNRVSLNISPPGDIALGTIIKRE